jgi:hypothetical protein
MPESLTHEFQYSNARHQAESAISGMWIFLVTEALFFGGLFLSWIYSRHWNQAGFDAGAQQTDLAIGTINTAILVTSSLAYSEGVAFIEVGNTRRLIQCCAIAVLLVVASSNSASSGARILASIYSPDRILPSTARLAAAPGFSSPSTSSALRCMGCICSSVWFWLDGSSSAREGRRFPPVITRR